MDITTTDNYTNINKQGDAFSLTAKLAEYAINPAWKDGYNALVNPNVYSDYKFLWQTVSASCEDIGGDIYKKILNYINNISNIDTCEIHALQSFAKMYGFNESLLFMDFSFPNEILELINIFSVNKAYITGPNSILTTASIGDIAALSGNDEAYVQYIYSVIYNTLLNFCNLQYRAAELTENDHATIWQNNIAKYSTNLFSQDLGIDSSIMLKKIALNIPMYFPERQYVDDIQAGLRKLTDFTPVEQVILNMELARRAKTQSSFQNISKYSYERENKVAEYFKFITLMANNTFTTIPYDIDSKKSLIISENLQNLIVYNGTAHIYELDVSLIQNITKNLVDLCLRISYIRETMKAQAQKYYMSGTNALLVNLIKEVLFSTLYNDINSTSGYWRYTSTNNKTLLEKNLPLNPNFDVDIIEYTDPTEYFNVGANSIESVNGNVSGINTRYWENTTALDGDITTDELLEFYNRLGLGDLFTNTYATSSSALTSSQYGALSAYSLSGFLGTLFNAGATSATSSDVYTNTLSSLGVSSTYTPMALSSWNNVVYGTDIHNVNRYIATNTLSGLYTSNDGINWAQINTDINDGWSAVTYGTNQRLFVATNSLHGIYYSADGLNWNKEPSTNIDTNWVNVTYGSKNNKFCAINATEGIYWSQDGANWINANTYTGGVSAGWSDIVFNGGSSSRYLASNSIYGLYYSTDCMTWTNCTGLSGTPGWVAVASSTTSSNNFIAVNSISGIFYSLDGITFTQSTSPANTSGWVNATSIAGNYIASHNTSGLFYSNDASTFGKTWFKNTSANASGSGWSTLNFNNGIFTGQDLALSGLCYSNTGSGEWYPASGTLLTSGTYIIPTSTYTSAEFAPFTKYSGNNKIGILSYTNIKNTIHSSYQLHPFMLAFKQYQEATAGIQNLYNAVIPDLATVYKNIQNRIDCHGNTVNYWLDGNIDFSGYTSKYEQSIKTNQLQGLDSPFNFDALSAYYTNTQAFSSTTASAASAYYDFLPLTESVQTTINNQLSTFFNNIVELSNYSIYKYGQDTFGNVYMLYKKINTQDQLGQLWIRLKDHPIPFPAFIPDINNPGQLSNLGQISTTTLNTLASIVTSSQQYQPDNPPSTIGSMQFNNLTFAVSGLTDLSNTLVTITTLTTPVSVLYTSQSPLTFNTIGLSANNQLSAYFPNDISGYTLGNSVIFNGFTPTISSLTLASSPNYITFNSGNIILSSKYTDTTVNVVGSNAFNIGTIDYMFYPNLDTFYDFGFNYTKDILFLDYPPATQSIAYANSNTMFGYINNSNVDTNGNKLLQYLKETTHNLETLPQNLINTYNHIDTLINEKDMFFIYWSISSNRNIDGNYIVNIYLFKYNEIKGLSYKLYYVPVIHNTVFNTEWKATVSDSILSIAFMSENPLVTDVIGNYISGTVPSSNTLSGGQTQFESILPTAYLNGITVIQFNIATDLPIVYNTVKYFYKHTDLGFYPQYYGPNGINNFYANPEINTAAYYNLQLYITPSNGLNDFIYEQTFSNNMALSGIYTDMLNISAPLISDLDATHFLYTSTTYPLSANPSLSSEPMKWFRKFDLSGNYPLSNPALSSGVDLSLTTLSPSSYLYHNDESTFSGYNSAFFPQLSAQNVIDTTYGLLVLDQNYIIQVYYITAGATDAIGVLYFNGINDDYNTTILLNTEGQTVNFVYTINGISRTYAITLINVARKQFSIARI